MCAYASINNSGDMTLNEACDNGFWFPPSYPLRVVLRKIMAGGYSMPHKITAGNNTEDGFNALVKEGTLKPETLSFSTFNFSRVPCIFDSVKKISIKIYFSADEERNRLELENCVSFVERIPLTVKTLVLSLSLSLDNHTDTEKHVELFSAVNFPASITSLRIEIIRTMSKLVPKEIDAHKLGNIAKIEEFEILETDKKTDGLLF